jgi:hypothetical protein
MAFCGPGEAQTNRSNPRNASWQHLTNRHVISMPDKWNIPGMPLGILLHMAL